MKRAGLRSSPLRFANTKVTNLLLHGLLVSYSSAYFDEVKVKDNSDLPYLAIPLQYETPFSMVGLSLSDLPNVMPWLVPEIQNV
ncbi:unnamed protein product [Sphenostylis stenocarpa]|uniref:Uncharacterized protein n=1 Tax=Sphenostylis stenocarpa TaxID=92480 RepID=A0AA86RLX8_9FABA|nr:unnamed protein product [Sphenostylis stenocarpa]